MNKIEKVFVENLGFSSEKARVYLAILEMGESKVVDISKKTKIKRTSCYNFLSELIKDGFIKSTKRAKKNFYFVDDPRILEFDVEDKLENIKTIIPELQKIHSIFPYKPKISFFEGENGMKEIYNDISNSFTSGGEILSIIGSSDLRKYVPKQVEDKYLSLRLKKKVVNKIICTDNQISQEWKKNAEKELREVKIVNKDKFDFKADIKIYKNKVAFLSYKENYIGVVIESSEIVGIQRMFFNSLWNVL